MESLGELLGRIVGLEKAKDETAFEAEGKMVQIVQGTSKAGAPMTVAIIESKEKGEPVGSPDLSQYKESAEIYYQRYIEYRDLGRKAKPFYHDKDPKAAFADGSRRYAIMVDCTWGLIARGAESMPFALKLLRSKDADTRSHAASVFMGLGEQQGVVSELLDAPQQERNRLVDDGKDREALDSIVAALGGMRAKAAIPALAELVRDNDLDSDSRWTAVESLGMVVRRRFIKQAEPIQSAEDWLKKHGY